MNNLSINKVEWFDIETLSFTLSNGESCTAGSRYKVNKSHTFDPNKKITKVECIINKSTQYIMRINFYTGQKRLVLVGNDYDDYVKEYGGRIEIFEIADDEQLIGCELD